MCRIYVPISSWPNWAWANSKEWLFSDVGLSLMGIASSVLGLSFIFYKQYQQQKQIIIQNNHTNIISLFKRLLIGIFLVSAIGFIIGINAYPRTSITKEKLGVSKIILESFFETFDVNYFIV